MEVIPPRLGSWVEVLPAPWDSNPEVVAVMVPNEALLGWAEAPDGTRFAFVRTKTTMRGLQVTEPKLGAVEQVQALAEIGLELVSPSYIGPLADLPQAQLLPSTRQLLLLKKDSMWRPYFNIKAYLADQYVDDESGVRDPLN